MSVAIGQQAPHFKLPATDGSIYGFTADDEPAPATVVYFTCNHCPYAQAWEQRMHAAGRDYAPRGVRFFAINPNDADRYPADSFEQMRRRVTEEDWPFPYLRDEDQIVAVAYGAKTTPDVFVFDGDRRLAYRGAPDADYQEPSLDAAWLRAALEAVLGGEPADPAETEPVGCSIKWK